jgi:hypothetical protein
MGIHRNVIHPRIGSFILLGTVLVGRFLNREAHIVWALLRREIRRRGSPRVLLVFGRCFPG